MAITSCPGNYANYWGNSMTPANPYGYSATCYGYNGSTTTLPNGCVIKCPNGVGWPTYPYPPYPTYPSCPSYPNPNCPPGGTQPPCIPPPFGGDCGGNGGNGGSCDNCSSCDPVNAVCGPDSCACKKNSYLDAASVFGGMYRSELLQQELAAGTTGQTLVMDSPLRLQNVGFSGDTLTIMCSGTYELTFFGNFKFDGPSGAGTNLSFYVKANGKKLEETVVEKSAQNNVMDSFERTVIVHLCANTSLRGIVDNAAASGSGAGGGNSGTLMIPANGIHLNVVRIGPY